MGETLARIYSVPDVALSLVQPLESIMVKWWGGRSLVFEWGVLRPYSLEVCLSRAC